MKQYLKKIGLQAGAPTPQSAPLPGQVANSAGGYTWQVDDWARLRRFLILGSEGGTYYIREQALTVENANNVLTCIQHDGLRVVREIVAISTEGRAPKPDPAIFALALVCSLGDTSARKAALDALPQVCRTGTHLFSFVDYVQTMRGWGRGLRRAVAGWYRAMNARQLAYQVVKYRQRGGWTHADTLRLAHPKPRSETENALYRWITGRANATKRAQAAWAWDVNAPTDEALAFVWAFERVQEAKELHTVLKLIEAYDLPREAVPTEWLRYPAVWEALLPKMPMTAMIRNLATMTRSGFLAPMNDAARTIIARLTDSQLLQKARVHPIAVLIAMRTYGLGYSPRGRRVNLRPVPSAQMEWTPVQAVMDALDSAFGLAFRNVEPVGKRFMLALDVSGSMSMGMVAGAPGLTPREGAAAMAMVTARKEQQYMVVAFQKEIVPLDITSRMSINAVMKATSGLPFGATDCAQPILYAQTQKLGVDTFIVYTDSETWAGTIHPAAALRDYRQKTGIAARMIVVGMTSNGFTIADPNDGGMLDVVGFDSAAPELIADFARGQI